MAGENEEITANFLNVQRLMSGALRGIDQRHNAAGAGAGAEFDHRVNRTEGVGNVGESKQFDIAGEPFVDAAHIEEAAITRDWQVNKLNTDFIRQELPRDNVAMVLHLGEEDLVAALEKFISPGMGDEIDALGRAPGEDDLIDAPRIEELRGPGTGSFVGGTGAVTQLVDAAMHIGVVMLVIVQQGIDHLPGFLGRGRVVEIDEVVPIHLLVENGEIPAQVLKVWHLFALNRLRGGVTHSPARL